MTAPGCTVAALGFTLLAAGPGAAAAQLRRAPVICDGMVLQRQATVPVWGWAERGDTIVVTFDRQTYAAVPDTGGQWVVKLPPRAAGGPYEMTVAGKRARLQVRNILVGDVWLCAGQSNMVTSVEQARNAAQEIAAARDLRIRQFKVPSYRDQEAGLPMAAAWTVADSAHVGRFTAVGYFFARELRPSVDVPIGLINVAVGGSAIEQWMRRETLGLDTAEVASLVHGTSKYKAVRAPTLLYDQMVYPLLPYPIKGILWYQGEANSGYSFNIPNKYPELFASLIQDWRRAWGLGDLPFLFVQLPSIKQPDSVPALIPGIGWVLRRESQSTALRLPNTAQVVTIDLNDEGALHLTNKQDVGARLALAARKVAYGEAVEHSGPRYRRHTLQSGRVLLEFDHVGRGLVVGRQGGELQGFAIAGADQKFVWATAKIDRDRVVVWSEDVPQPVAVRYAWSDNPIRANLYNRAGLPAAPFRTDEWPHAPVTP
jgi:sialate O-acetylesterase